MRIGIPTEIKPKEGRGGGFARVRWTLAPASARQDAELGARQGCYPVRRQTKRARTTLAPTGTLLSTQTKISKSVVVLRQAQHERLL